MRNIPYTCKICGLSRTAQADDDAPGIWISKLAKLLTCNSCYTYRDKINRAHRWISMLAIATNNIKAVNDGKPETILQGLLEPIRIRLVKGTKRLAEIVCNHYGRAVKWEPKFVALIMERPEKVHQILNDYERGIKGGQYQ